MSQPNPHNIHAKSVVVVKRMWHSPEIHAFVDHQQVGAQMDLQDFTRALIDEIYGESNRTFMATKADTLAKALEGVDKILAAMKSTTSNVV